MWASYGPYATDKHGFHLYILLPHIQYKCLLLKTGLNCWTFFADTNLFPKITFLKAVKVKQYGEFMSHQLSNKLGPASQPHRARGHVDGTFLWTSFTEFPN